MVASSVYFFKYQAIRDMRMLLNVLPGDKQEMENKVLDKLTD